MAITLFINGKREEIDGPIPIPELLESKRIRPQVSTVYLNKSVLKRDALTDAIAREGDTVEIMIQLAGGSDER